MVQQYLQETFQDSDKHFGNLTMYIKMFIERMR
jgi:hypothetical protein